MVVYEKTDYSSMHKIKKSIVPTMPLIQPWLPCKDDLTYVANLPVYLRIYSGIHRFSNRKWVTHHVLCCNSVNIWCIPKWQKVHSDLLKITGIFWTLLRVFKEGKGLTSEEYFWILRSFLSSSWHWLPNSKIDKMCDTLLSNARPYYSTFFSHNSDAMFCISFLIPDKPAV